MKQPPSIQPASGPGPAYDPMDRIVEDLQNIQNFISKLADDPKDKKYLSTHLSQILSLRRTISHQLDLLTDEPYNYSPARLSQLHKENEKIFLHLEGMIGAIAPWNEDHFNKFMDAIETTIEKFDDDLTP